MIVALIGSHGVGKTSLGRALAARTGLRFDEELGRTMAEDPDWRPRGVTASDAASPFDEELFRRERARDHARVGVARVVETWHPGNLAYAQARSPDVAGRWRARLRAALAGEVVLVQPLIAPEAVLRSRQSEPGELAYYLRVGAAALHEAQALGLQCLPVLHTHGASPEALAEQVMARLAQVPAPQPHLPTGV